VEREQVQAIIFLHLQIADEAQSTASNTTVGDRPLGVESRKRRCTEPKQWRSGSPTAIESGEKTDLAVKKPPERSSKSILSTGRAQTQVTPRKTRHHGGQAKWKGTATRHSVEDNPTDESPHSPARRGFTPPTPLRPSSPPRRRGRPGEERKKSTTAAQGETPTATLLKKVVATSSCCCSSRRETLDTGSGR
jgi:hypothetical protein